MNGIIRKDGRALPTRWMGNIHWVSYPWLGCSQGSGGVNHKVSGLHRNPFIHINEPESQPPNKHDPDCKSQTPKALPEWSCKCGLFFASVPNLTQLSPFPILSKKMTIWRQNQFLSDWPQKSPLNKAWPYFLHFLTTFRQTHNFQVSHQIVLVF